MRHTKYRRHNRKKTAICISAVCICVIAGSVMAYRYYVKNQIDTEDTVAVTTIGNITIRGVVTEEMKAAAEYLNKQGYQGDLTYQTVADSDQYIPNGVQQSGAAAYYLLNDASGDSIKQIVCIKTTAGFVSWDPDSQSYPGDDLTAAQVETKKYKGNLIVKAKVPDDFHGNILVTLTYGNADEKQLNLSPQNNYTVDAAIPKDGNEAANGGTLVQCSGELSEQQDKYYVDGGMFTIPEDEQAIDVLHVLPIDAE